MYPVRWTGRATRAYFGLSNATALYNRRQCHADFPDQLEDLAGDLSFSAQEIMDYGRRHGLWVFSPERIAERALAFAAGKPDPYVAHMAPALADYEYSLWNAPLQSKP